jgi:hypothetical protein
MAEKKEWSLKDLPKALQPVGAILLLTAIALIVIFTAIVVLIVATGEQLWKALLGVISELNNTFTKDIIPTAKAVFPGIWSYITLRGGK